MASVAANGSPPDILHKALLYHFCRLQVPQIPLSEPAFERHLQRCFDLYRAKKAKSGTEKGTSIFSAATPSPQSLSPAAGERGRGEGKKNVPFSDWQGYLENLYAVDWFLCCSCLEGEARAWEGLFAARASRADCLLVDALRARAVRLFPRDAERQDSAVTEFWGYLLAGEKTGSAPILARYDGQRPLVPWLIRVFQNRHISELRQHRGVHPLPDEDLDEHDLLLGHEGDGRWHEEFRLAAREWLQDLGGSEILILGLRMRYRLSQREVAGLLGVHEGNISRHTAKLRDHCLDHIGRRLLRRGWTGDDLNGFVLKEMDSLIMDEPGLSADRLAALLATRGKKLPDQESGERRE